MSSRFITEDELRKRIRKSTDSIASFAKDNGITPQQVNAFLQGIQGAGYKIPKAFDLVPIVVFVPPDDPNARPPYRPLYRGKK